MSSLGNSYCNEYGVSTRTDAYEAWIGEFLDVTPDPGPDCSADGTCNTECDPGADPDCATPEPGCGNGVCEAGEDCDSCPSDCAEITHPKQGRLACCGNGMCEKHESANVCAVDCQ